MISPELIRRFPFFADLSQDQIQTLAITGSELNAAAGHIFFHEGEATGKFYLVVEGEVTIFLGVTDHSKEHRFSEQLFNHVATEDITISTCIAGELFGWSGLIPPHVTTAGARASTDCKVMEFDVDTLEPYFEKDCRFAYLMILKAAQTMRERVRCLQIESLAFLPRKVFVAS